MRKLMLTAALCTAAIAAGAARGGPIPEHPLSILVANSTAHPLSVRQVTLAGNACPDCTARTILPGAAAMIRIGLLHGRTLRIVLAGSGTGTRIFTTNGRETSLNGGTFDAPARIGFSTDVGPDYPGLSPWTPAYTVIYAYDVPPGQ